MNLAMWEYEAVDSKGELRRAVRLAPDEQDVAQHVMARGLDLTDIRLRPWWKGLFDDLPWTRPDKDALSEFFQDFGLMVGSGGDDYQRIFQVLANDARRRRQKRFAEALEAIGYEATETSSISDAMERFPFAFTPLMTALVRAGERGAGLESAALDVYRMLEDEVDFDAKMREALQQGRLNLTVFAVLLYGTFGFAVPELVKSFTGPGKIMPPILGAASVISQATQNPLMMALFIGLVFVMWFPWMLKALPTGRMPAASRATGWLGLHMPFFGVIRRLAAQGRFASTMGMLWRRSGEPNEALALAIPATGNVIYVEGLSEITDAYSEGIALSVLLRETKLCDERLLLPLERAEEGQLDVADRLTHIGSKLREAARRKLNAVVAPLGTALVVAVGLLGVAFAIALSVLVYQVFVSYATQQ